MEKQVIPEIYLKALVDNEADANKKMTIVNAIAAGVALILWALYLGKVFIVPDTFFIVICILFPVGALVLLTPLLYLKTDRLRKPRYKNFLVFTFILVVAAINIMLPRHGLLGWTLAIAMACHYYNPKFALKVYIVTLLAMLGCIYLGAFFGEYDPLILGPGVVRNGVVVEVDALDERIAMLDALAAQGNNRLLKAFTMYYFPRALAISLLFVITNSLNRRTSKLLREEVRVHGEQEKDKAELNIAKEIQLETLPTETIKDSDLEIVGELNAAKEVGGDLYDYHEMDENHVAILIGDVSGKGVPAAMFMMKTITSFRDFATAGKSPSQILKEINTSIKKGNKAGMFVTCFLAIIDRRNGHIVYSNAGHNPPIIGTDHNYSYLKPNQGLLLGVFDNIPIKDEEIILKPGESITLYTDGFTEARNLSGEFLGEERLLELFNGKSHASISELHQTLKDGVDEFENGAPQSDDITVVTLKYRGDYSFHLEKVFDGTKESIKEMLEFVGKFIDEQEISEAFKNKLLVVGDELFSNIVNYGYRGKGGPITIRLSLNSDTHEFSMAVIDKAKEFNQLNVDIPANPDEPRIGGYGIFIVKSIMDEYSYNYIDGQNILLLKKKF